MRRLSQANKLPRTSAVLLRRPKPASREGQQKVTVDYFA
jgi:hypothetical protein